MFSLRELLELGLGRRSGHIYTAATFEVKIYKYIFNKALSSGSPSSLGTLSNDDAEDDALQKEYSYFTLECCNCVRLFITPNGVKTSLG